MGNLTAGWLVNLNLASDSESVLTFAKEVVAPLLFIKTIRDKTVFPVLTVGLFCVVFDIVEVDLANGERESLNVKLLLSGHIGSGKSFKGVLTSD